MPIPWLLLGPTLTVALVRSAPTAASLGLVSIGLAVLAVSCLAFLVSVVAFAAPYGVACLRIASSISRSIFGYAGRARFTLRQRSSAAP